MAFATSRFSKWLMGPNALAAVEMPDGSRREGHAVKVHIQAVRIQDV